MKNSECVKVVIRCRPMSIQEQLDKRQCIIDMDSVAASVTIHRPMSGLNHVETTKQFTFDHVFPPNTPQSDVYDKTGSPIVENVLEGYNGTIFAYGQTGTGKTFTMVGPQGTCVDTDLSGLIPRAFTQIFESIKTTNDLRFLVHASYLEIYNEEIRDLLSKTPKDKLELHDRPDSGVFVKDLSTTFVDSVEQIHRVLSVGQRNRSTGSTLMNQESSRSHSIFSVTVETCLTDSLGEQHVRVGKLNLVDLAGSERQSKTGSTGDQFKEATKINLSLSALGNVISALVETKVAFVPYRDSKLTRLLQDSLGGNTKTVMLANIGPADYNFEETMSTLRYANRAKNITNKPKINEDPTDAVIRKYQEEIDSLKRELAKATRARQGSVNTPSDDNLLIHTPEDHKQVLRHYEEEKRDILAAKYIAEEEKRDLLLKLDLKAAAEEEHAKEQDQLVDRLKSMEAKLLKGSEVLERAAQQERELQRARRDLEERILEESRIKRIVEEHEEERILLVEKFDSQADHVATLSDKLQAVWEKYKSAAFELKELRAEYSREKEDFFESMRVLSKDLSFHKTLMDCFIPADEFNRIASRCTYDDASQRWMISAPKTSVIHPTPRIGVAAPGNCEPVISVADDYEFQITRGRSSEPCHLSHITSRVIQSTLGSSLYRCRYFSVDKDGDLVRDHSSTMDVEESLPRRAQSGRGFTTTHDYPSYLSPKSVVIDKPDDTDFPKARGLVKP